MTDAPDPRPQPAPDSAAPSPSGTGAQGPPPANPWAVPHPPYPPPPPRWVGGPGTAPGSHPVPHHAEPPGNYPPGPPGAYAPRYGYLAPPPPFLDGRTLPTEHADYQQLLGGPGRAWWRPLLSLALLLGGLVFGTMVIVVTAILAGWALGGANARRWTDDMLMGSMEDPVTFTVLMFGIIILIPVVMLAVTVAHRVRPGFIVSVTGRFRWGWFARCVALVLPLWLVYLLGSWALDGAEVGTRPARWPVLAVLVLLLTPLQSAAEEYTFRGWFMLSLGSWFRHRWVALVVPTVFSVALFALAHGSFDPWILSDLAVFAIAATVLTWRTGGLEAAIALHAVNNMTIMGVSLAFGGFGSEFVDSSSTGDPLSVLVNLILQAIAVGLIWRMADRRDLPWRFQPRPRPLTGGYSLGEPMPPAAYPPAPPPPSRPTL